MKIWSIVFSAMLALTFAFGAADADAKRLGGGRSVGKQSSNVTQREASPAAPANNNVAGARPGAPAAGAPPIAPKRPWGAMLGGLAAGLGLAWLASSLGLGGAFGQVIMFALLAFGVMLLIGFVMRRLKGANVATPNHQAAPFAFQGAGDTSSPSSPVTPRNYSPENVGNDASARPWERSGLATASGTGSMIGSGLAGNQSWGVPADFDADGFLRAMMTDDMLEQIKTQLGDRESHTGGGTNKTEVVMLNAQLLGIEELSDSYMASVEFSGMIKEDASAGASPFREVWNMTKPRSGGGWLVAGVQALQ